ncbi:hypothetical protein [Actinacidiphila soli]|uniref:hypothetical protein n=1 Tax=Actinacidiphila soli TaxID=2487275 RepID=UPI000FCA8B04|nr:hypothetical protein [Actinacidiphila soli]
MVKGTRIAIEPKAMIIRAMLDISPAYVSSHRWVPGEEITPRMASSGPLRHTSTTTTPLQLISSRGPARTYDKEVCSNAQE